MTDLNPEVIAKAADVLDVRMPKSPKPRKTAAA